MRRPPSSRPQTGKRLVPRLQSAKSGKNVVTGMSVSNKILLNKAPESALTRRSSAAGFTRP